jgi:tRNA threonylcarbamoyladenosine biosynthesis protein TsaE
MTRLDNVDATIAWGRTLADTLSAGDVVALVGTLGAGKTHAAKGIVAGLGSALEVSSPTFTLVHEYPGPRLAAFHFDFYRLTSAPEVINIGWDDYLDAGGVVIVEWADKFPELLPPSTRWFRFQILPDGARSVEELEASSVNPSDSTLPPHGDELDD